MVSHFFLLYRVSEDEGGRVPIIVQDGGLDWVELDGPTYQVLQCSQQASPSGFGYGRTDLGFFWVRPD